MSDSHDSPGGKRGPESKVSRLLRERGFDGFGAELERRWTAEAGARSSLRDLADAFNRRLLRAALDGRNERALDGEIETLYRVLTDDDVSSGARTKAVHRLERTGVDVERLEADFVSHRAMRTYLTSYRGVTPPSETDRDDGDLREHRTETIRRLLGRVERVTEKSLSDLAAADELDVDPETAEVYVDVRVHCPDCNAHYTVESLIDRGGCDCD
ncbi:MULTISPECIES: rod-determining factor RdfA [Haloferax]|uniref:Uncharacterized protein n=4 Tax=Haloferax TaxID=2251 RepID=D4GPH5_HALVD|nr:MULTISPECIES: rod-determining factor RdfA [Haloferax]ADE01568.1 uncharacterized protein HVO_B0174 [Haloferax volcanii DS2]ELY36405.1 hypothetical protein C498_02770 [Haloferax volcanii DS2]MBS8120348.1 hypothetical protein [Haloferax volcanii]MBS8125385.1 hypothetical protein [Haloferax volcanii]MBS8129252.1 hypothetical protein [Haloferax volcanii]